MCEEKKIVKHILKRVISIYASVNLIVLIYTT